MTGKIHGVHRARPGRRVTFGFSKPVRQSVILRYVQTCASNSLYSMYIPTRLDITNNCLFSSTFLLLPFISFYTTLPVRRLRPNPVVFLCLMRFNNLAPVFPNTVLSYPAIIYSVFSSKSAFQSFPYSHSLELSARQKSDFFPLKALLQ